LVSHFVWLAASGKLVGGYAGIVFLRSTKTAFGLVLFVLMAEIISPMPSVAADGVWSTSLIVLFCLFIIALVMFVIGAFIYTIYGLASLASKKIAKSKDGKINDLGSILLAC